MVKVLRVNRNFGEPSFDLRNYKLGLYHRIEFLVSRYSFDHCEEGIVTIDNSEGKLASYNRTFDVIRQLKSKDWDLCYGPEEIINYLVDIDPTVFRRVNKIIYCDEDDFILEDKDENNGK